MSARLVRVSGPSMILSHSARPPLASSTVHPPIVPGNLPRPGDGRSRYRTHGSPRRLGNQGGETRCENDTKEPK